jgi:hypothetical protein
VAILALCPSRGRPNAARETLRSFEATRRDPATRLVFLVDDDDPTAGEPEGNTRIVRPTGYMGGALAIAGRDRELLADATAVGMLGDDNRFRTPGWDVTFDAWLSQAPGIAYGDDGFQHERLPTSWWVSRPIVDVFGIVLPSSATTTWTTTGRSSARRPAACATSPRSRSSTCTRSPARARGRDLPPRRGQRPERPRDVRALEPNPEAARRRPPARDPRRAAAAPDPRRLAPPRALGIARDPVRRSLRLGALLADRARLDGHGWRLEGGTPGWTAADYLTFPEASLAGDHYELAGAEYPDRQRKLVTWEQAAGQRWDFVLASVPTHQRSFAELARKLRARFIHQVGNAKHGIDRGVPRSPSPRRSFRAGRRRSSTTRSSTPASSTTSPRRRRAPSRR